MSATLVPPRPPENPFDTIRLLQEELAQTNREVLMLNLELEERLEALRGAEQRYRRLAETAPDIIFHYELRPAGRVTFMNPRVAAIAGYEPEEFYADPELLFRIVQPDDRDRMDSVLRGTAPNAGMTTMRWIHKKGAVIWIEQHHVLVQNQSGDILGVECIARDITERKQLEEQFRQAQKMEAIGRLAGGIAHDFNNLLTVINGYSSQILAEIDVSHPYRQDLEEVVSAGNRAAMLTRQLLAFSRHQVVQPRTLNLNDIVSDMDRMLRRVLGEDIELVTVLDSSLDLILTDPGQMEQVIMNLVVNARDAMPSGGKLVIETAMVDLDAAYSQQHRSVAPGRYVMFAVTDSGQGMDEATMARIFEPFFTTKPVGQGTGLGLSTVYGIVQKSGGTVWVYSEPGTGTTFKIYIPRSDKVEEPKEDQRAAKQLRGTETLLVVEDDESVAKLLRFALQNAGYRVLEARNGEEAIALVESKENAVELLLTDIVMPGISGWELSQRLAKTRPNLRYLFMSGYTDNAVVQRGMLDAGVPFLQKPFTPTSLVEKVRLVLDR